MRLNFSELHLSLESVAFFCVQKTVHKRRLNAVEKDERESEPQKPRQTTL